MESFDLLSEKRVSGEGGPQPIPVSEISAYADYFKIEGEMIRKDFLEYISLLDRIYLIHRYKKLASNRKKEAQKAKQESRRK